MVGLCLAPLPCRADYAVGTTLPQSEQLRKYKIIASRDPAFPVNTYASLADLSRNGEALAVDKSTAT